MNWLPLKDSSGSLDIAQLPDKAIMLQMLQSELPPLLDWHQIAVRYYEDGQVDAFVEILKQASSDDLEKMPQYTQSRGDRILILNCLASYYCSCALNSTNPNQRDNFITETATYISRSDKLDLNDKTNWISKGFKLLAENQLENASYYFNNAQ
jgi:hypothetical protein